MTVTTNPSINGGVSSSGSGTGGGTSGEVVTDAEFQALVVGNALVEGTTYYVSDLPAMWLATGSATYNGIQFEEDGTIYIGDQEISSQTEIDLAAGTWATRPTTGFTTGTMYYRRMTDIGTDAGGACVMSWLGGTSTEWHVTQPIWAIYKPTLTSGTQNTSAQALCTTAIPAGLLSACSTFDIFYTVAKTGTTDAMTQGLPLMGETGTTADTVLRGLATGALASGDRGRSVQHSYRVYDATHIRLLGSSNTSGSWLGTTNTAAVQTEYTLTAANAMYLSLGVTMATAAADTPQCAFLGLRLNP